MEYKIGQRVKHKRYGVGFIELLKRDKIWVKSESGKTNEDFCSYINEISPLYKPGDQVRVTSTEEELADIALDGVVTKGSIIAVEGYIEGGWIKFDGWSINIKYVEWYSGVEDKPDDAEQFFDSLQEHEMHGFSTPEEYIKWLKDDTILVAEVHQDKDRNRAALAEVLKIKETPQQLWKCPYYDNHTHRPCSETGSKHDIRQHSKTAHGEALPPTNSPVWEHWRVS